MKINNMTYYTKTLLLVILLVSFYILFINFGMQEKNLKIESSAFIHNESIPSKYTCDGENIIPALKISGIDENAKSLVLIMNDPDVPLSVREDGMWNHWVKFNIPVSESEFEILEGVEPEGVSGIGTGKNLDYMGPCPPDREHRYFFKVYSLNTMLGLQEGSIKEEVENAMEGKILQSTELIGLYDRNLE